VVSESQPQPLAREYLTILSKVQLGQYPRIRRRLRRVLKLRRLFGQMDGWRGQFQAGAKQRDEV